MSNVVDSIIRVLCTAIMGIMVVAVCWQVITRYILNNPSTVTEEALRYLLVWTTMVGAAYAYGKRKHLSINILLKKVSPSMQKIVDIGVQCLVIVFCIVVIWEVSDFAPLPRISLPRLWGFPCLISTAACWWVRYSLSSMPLFLSGRI